jgi:hypothetical protein
VIRDPLERYPRSQRERWAHGDSIDHDLEVGAREAELEDATGVWGSLATESILDGGARSCRKRFLG